MNIGPIGAAGPRRIDKVIVYGTALTKKVTGIEGDLSPP